MKYYSTTVLKGLLCLLLLSAAAVSHAATTYIQNVYGRHSTSLNGKWSAIVDPYDAGYNMRVFLDRKSRPSGNFYEYDFDGATRLNVPGDWNSQRDELKYYEGTVWYARHFNFTPTGHQRHFLYFAGVSNRCKVYLNGQLIATHEGAFTPFQVEVGDKLVSGDNLLVVAVNNTRRVDAIPAMSFDWWNYGGITRDVMLVTLPDTYISDYFIRLDKHRSDLLLADVSLSRPVAGQRIVVTIPGAGVKMQLTTDANGVASGRLSVRKLQRWSPDKPTLYATTITAPNDTVTEQIGFRNINVEKTKVLLNGQPVFLRGVSFHEEIAQRMGRATSMADAVALVTEAKNLGCNMVRLAHYQQNEYIVREAERQGLMVWQEVPVWQSIDFTNDSTLRKAQQMLRETILRDRNRCADCFWGIANETKNTPARNRFLAQLLKTGKEMDTTRLFVAAFDLAYFDKQQDEFVMHDDFYPNLDLVGINKYMGWYAKWPKDPSQIRWNVAPGMPLLISEFGGEALYGQHGDDTNPDSWSEDYQAKLYRDNLRMFENIPNLCGISPWVLFDFRSPTRLHSTNQEGWNRKGLISDQGQRKEAWYIMHDYYMKKKSK
jgi:beta-glucuronidase